MSKSKILLISKLPPPYYGTTVWSGILLNSGLKEHFNLVHLNNNIHTNIKSLGKFSFRNIVSNLKLYLKLIRILKSEKPNLVFIPVSQTTLGFIKDSIFIILSRVFRRKILLILHGSNFLNWFKNSGYITKSYVKRCLYTTEGIVVLGEKLKYMFEGFYPAERIFSVPNGADFIFPPRQTSDKFKLLYLGNLQPSKGIEDILIALTLLSIPKDGYRLDVVGNWRSPESELKSKNIVKENQLPVFFHGPVFNESKYEFFSSADVFIFTPREPEGHPYVIVEAIAAGLPIISTDKGAISESVIDGINGYIVEDRNPGQIADKINHLFMHPELRGKMAEASNKIYKENFTEEIMTEKYSSVFETILQKNNHL
jgi:glycosyltransferase involved in cell wall biosynthesis